MKCGSFETTKLTTTNILCIWCNYNWNFTILYEIQVSLVSKYDELTTQMPNLPTSLRDYQVGISYWLFNPVGCIVNCLNLRLSVFHIYWHQLFLFNHILETFVPIISCQGKNLKMKDLLIKETQTVYWNIKRTLTTKAINT